MKPKTYRIKTLADMFAVPVERREAMLREVAYSMTLTELVAGEKASQALVHIDWTDDGITEVDLQRGGESLMTMVVRKEGEGEA